MRILVTGATGFVGRHIVDCALARGHEVGVLVRSNRLTRPAHDSGRLLTFAGSMAAVPWAEVHRFAPEACIHAAWISTPGIYLDSPENELHRQWSNAFVLGLREMGCRHVTVLGTCAEYRPCDRPLREDDPPPAIESPYALAKRQLREALALALVGSGTGFAWARIFHPYGAGEHPDRLCSALIRKIHAGEVLVLRTPHAVKDYIHASDVADALLEIATQRLEGPINVGSGVGISVGDLARKLGGMLGHPGNVRFAPEAVNDPNDCMVADVSRLRSVGWKAQVSLESGLAGLIQQRAS